MNKFQYNTVTEDWELLHCLQSDSDGDTVSGPLKRSDLVFDARSGRGYFLVAFCVVMWIFKPEIFSLSIQGVQLFFSAGV
jgi:hypothetical protein